jgi:hypothetical protein
MVGHLRQGSQGADAGESAADHAEVEPGDCETSGGAEGHLATVGSYERDRTSPTERERQMDRHGRQQQAFAPCLPGEEDGAGGLGRLQRVAAAKQRLGCRRGSAEDGRPRPGGGSVAEPQKCWGG